ncbi:hypothetical protein LWI29_036498 [Acer saccharum]|uniref:Uncharacterized protein n=1 Tax=Acer saccharum TaxID=4024 RepID=A0AA39RGR3_ACESA|nr:hypothetical protein LWI29_036498 [Acer saccharum]
MTEDKPKHQILSIRGLCIDHEKISTIWGQGLLLHPPAPLHTLASTRSTIGEMAARAARARGSLVQIQKQVPAVPTVMPSQVASPPPPPLPPLGILARHQLKVEKEKDTDKDQGESGAEGVPQQTGLMVNTKLPGTGGEPLGSVTGHMEVKEDTFEEETPEEERGGPAEELEEVVVREENPPKTVKIGSTLAPEHKAMLQKGSVQFEPEVDPDPKCPPKV